MSGALEADLLLDRRRLKRRLVFWRVVGIVALLAAALAIVAATRGFNLATGRYVARLPVSGIITNDRKRLDRIEALRKDGDVAAVILAVDSPGGSVAAGEALHTALGRLAAAKPLVTVMGGTAASAGYMISLPASRIFAMDSTLTGSIGVILETGNAGGLLDKIGIGAEAITSGPLKDQPSFTNPISPEGRAYLHGLVMDLFSQFVAMVASGRHMDEAAVRQLADGRAYTGKQAIALGLIDEIGGEPEARAWLAREKHVDETLPIRDVKQGSLYERTFGATLEGLWPASWLQALPQPGAWAIWRPGAF